MRQHGFQRKRALFRWNCGLLCLSVALTVAPTNYAEAPAGAAAAKVRLQKLDSQSFAEGIDLAMFPRVIPGPGLTAEAAAKINRSLDLFNAEVLADAHACSRSERALHRDFANDYQRTIEITMQGPRYLSLVAEDAYSCGGPHPDDSELALVYDLETGLPIDWTKFLPKDAVGHLSRSKGRQTIGYITWPRLMDLVRTHPSDGGNTPEDCAASYEDPQTAFNIWLDAADAAIVFSPQLRSHFDTAMCSQKLEIKAPEGRALGISNALLSDLART